jgi:hypothetical protein
MLLKDLMEELGIRMFPFDPPRVRGQLAPRPLPHSLALVGQFEFGDRYAIALTTGARVEVRQLDTLLDVIKSEFLIAETYDFTLVLAGKKTTNLFLRPKAVLGKPWDRDVSALCVDLASWVTQYNLSGEWPEQVTGHVHSISMWGKTRK